MLIWVVAILLAALAALIGYFMGGIRTAICLLGTIVAGYLATTVGGWVAGLVPLVGFKSPLSQIYLPPVFGFLIVSLVFTILAFVIFQLVERRVRYRLDEYRYARWRRLSRRTGAAIGAVLGTAWLVLLSIAVYVPAYASTQLAGTEESSGLLRLANRYAQDMEKTGMLEVVERYQPASDEHYHAANILGLVYHNPSIHERLASYPPFVAMAQREEIGELGRDPEVVGLLQSRAGMAEILAHPRIQAVAGDPELVANLRALDLADLESYLRTGDSKYFRDEPILGRWRLNPRRSIAAMKRVSTEVLPPTELNQLRRALNLYLEEMIAGFTMENRVLLKVTPRDVVKLMEMVGRTPPQVTGAQQTDGAEVPVDRYGQPMVGGGSGITARSLANRAIPQEDPAQRYGLSADRYGASAGGSGAAPQALLNPQAGLAAAARARGAVRTPNPSVLAPLMSTAEGSWSREGRGYKVSITSEAGQAELEVSVKDNRLTASVNGRILVFDRI